MIMIFNCCSFNSNLLFVVTAAVLIGNSNEQNFFDQFGNAVLHNPVTNWISSLTNRVSGQRWFGDRSSDLGANSFTRQIFQQAPIVGNCDRIAYQSIGNCLNNFRPSQVNSKGQCCAWRKYRACVNGIRDGIKIAARTQRCPTRSFSRSTIQVLSDQLAGYPVSTCPTNSCSRAKSG